MKQNQGESRTDEMHLNQVESRTDEMHLNQSYLNSSFLGEMLLSEISNAISANERMELSADPVMNEHVEPNTVREELYPADGSSVPLVSNSTDSSVPFGSNSTGDEMQEGVESNVTLDESVQVFRSDVQMDGADGQGHEGENGNNQFFQPDG